MSKSCFALRIAGGLLTALLLVLSLMSCAEDSKGPDDTSAASDYTETSGSSSSGTDNNDITDDPSETVDVYIVSSRSLTATTGEYNTDYSSGDLYWTYTAVKQDGYFTTGQVTVETPLNIKNGSPAKGLPDGSIGTFSVGKWLFSFYAYTSVTDEEENESVPWEYDDETGTYTFSSDCLYYTTVTESADTVTLSSSNSTIDVNVQLVEAIGDYGTLTMTVEGFKNSDGTDVSISGAYTLMYTLSDDTETLYEGELTLNDTTTLDTVEPGSYTLTVYLLTESGTLASETISVTIRTNLTTCVTGTLDESEDGTVSVYLGSYILTTDSDTYLYTYDEETGEYESEEVYTLSLYDINTDSLAYLVPVSADDNDEYTYTVTSYSSSDGYTFMGLRDSDGNMYYENDSITLTSNTSLDIIWSTVYVTPENAQSELDYMLSGQTIVFTSGSYNDELLIRNSQRSTISLYSDSEHYDSSSSLYNGSTTVYWYYRDLSNITFTSESGACFYNTISLSTGADDVLSETLESYSTKFGFINISGITFEEMTFKDAGGLDFRTVYVNGVSSTVTDLTVKECTFSGDEEGIKDSGPYAIRLNSKANGLISNVVIDSCEIEKYFQLIYTTAIKGLEVKGCDLSYGYNGVSVQSSSSTYFQGDIKITDNYIHDIWEYTNEQQGRAIRMGYGENAAITISGNKFKNATDGGELIKADSLTSCSLSISSDNTYLEDTESDDGTTVETSSSLTAVSHDSISCTTYVYALTDGAWTESYTETT